MDTMARRSLNALIGGALIAASFSACTPPGGPPRRPEPSVESEAQPGPSSASSKASPDSSAMAGVGPRALAPNPLVPTVDVEDASGKPQKGPAAALAPLRERMKECTAGRAGVVRVRIKTDKNRTSMDIEPGSSLDGSTHRCVMETLSTIDVDDVLSRGSPSERPPAGFTSIMRVEW